MLPAVPSHAIGCLPGFQQQVSSQRGSIDSVMNMKTIFIVDAALKRQCDGCHERQYKRFAFIIC